MLVTDKEYYIDKTIVEKLDLAIERQRVKWDNMWIVDGDEGSGKSTLAMQLAYYIANKIGKSFTVDNVFFEAEDMLKYAATHEGEVIVWDEAATSALSSMWQSKVQQKLIQVLMMARKKRHFFFFVIPKFWALKSYIVDRSIGLIHVYSPDLISRGKYVYFNKDGKDNLFYRFTQQKRYSYKIGFMGHPKDFFDKVNVIDNELYEKKKDQAINNLFYKKPKISEWKTKYDELKIRIGTYNPRIPHSLKKYAEIMGIPVRTLTDWRNMASEAGCNFIEGAKAARGFIMPDKIGDNSDKEEEDEP